MGLHHPCSKRLDATRMAYQSGFHSRSRKRLPRCSLYLPSVGDRLNMGKTDVGNLVGMGCQINVGAGSASAVPRLHCPRQRDRRPSCCRAGMRNSCVSWPRQYSYHPFFSRLVEYSPSGSDSKQTRHAIDPCPNALAATDNGTRL